MYGILGEDRTDFEMLREIVRKLRVDPSLKIEGRGFGGCGNLLNDGAKRLALLHEAGFRRFIICHDADGERPDDVRARVKKRIIETAGVESECCVAVPVQEIEAWILADIESAHQLFTSWRPAEEKSPERIVRPSEELERRSREGQNKKRYDRSVHNVRMAKIIDWARVAQKCPSFRPLRDFVLAG